MTPKLPCASIVTMLDALSCMHVRSISQPRKIYAHSICTCSLNWKTTSLENLFLDLTLTLCWALFEGYQHQLCWGFGWVKRQIELAIEELSFAWRGIAWFGLSFTWLPSLQLWLSSKPTDSFPFVVMINGLRGQHQYVLENEK